LRNLFSDKAFAAGIDTADADKKRSVCRHLCAFCGNRGDKLRKLIRASRWWLGNHGTADLSQPPVAWIGVMFPPDVTHAAIAVGLSAVAFGANETDPVQRSEPFTMSILSRCSTTKS